MKKLGEILIEQGLLLQSQLEKALERQRRESGKLLGEILIDMGFVSEVDIVAALAAQFNVPYLPIANFSLDSHLVKQVPKEILLRHICLPVDRLGNLLTIVIADPTNEIAIREIEEAMKCKVQVFVSTVSEIDGAIRQHLGTSVFRDRSEKTKPETTTLTPTKN